MCIYVIPVICTDAHLAAILLLNKIVKSVVIKLHVFTVIWLS